jgi:hypothetical protein
MLVAALAALSAMGQQTAPVAPERQLLIDIRQRDSAELRAAAMAQVRAMLEGDAGAQGVALQLLVRTADIRLERAGLAEKASKLLESPDAAVRRGALQALPALGPAPADLEAIAKMANDPAPAVRAGVAASYIAVGRALKSAQAVGEPVLTLLADDDRTVVLATAQSLWSVPLTEAVEAKVIALSEFSDKEAPGNGSIPYTMMYYVLSTRPVVSKAVAERLARIARHPLLDQNWTGRAIWGMARQVAPDAKDVVTKALVEELDHSLIAYNREWAVRGLGALNSPAAREKLGKVSKEDESEELRKLAGSLLLREF